jgi:hypothetical protein
VGELLFQRRSVFAGAWLALLLVGGWLWIGPAAGSPDDRVVVRVYYDDIGDLSKLGGYDLWEYNNLDEGYVLAAVDRAGYDALVAAGWRVAIDREAGEQLARRDSSGDGFYGGYRTVAELFADLEAMNAAAPELTELVEYGQSYCLGRGGCLLPGGETLPGFPLRALRVTNEAVAGSSSIDGGAVTRGDKPVFILIANIHAREISTPELAMRFLDGLLDGYGTDADMTWLIDYHEIWVVPTVNPDGHWLEELGAQPDYSGPPFFQRKNADNDANTDGAADCSIWPPQSSAQFGIDLNRNHSFDWGSVGSSSEPCDMTYRGPSAASEVEVAALEALIRALVPDRRGPQVSDPAPRDTSGLLITLHSFSNLVLWPWGNLFDDPPNRADLQAIGDKFATYNGYTSCQAGPCLYPTSGATDDWAYGELGIPAFTFEIGNVFMPPYEEIDRRQWPDNGPALFYAAKIARTPYLTAHGPDTLDLTVTTGDEERAVRATISDITNGNRPIAGAVYSIDVPPWEAQALLPLTPGDGAFDSPVEEATAILATDELTAGRHILYAQGQDDAGNWGAVSATFFEVETVIIPTDFIFIPGVLNR